MEKKLSTPVEVITILFISLILRYFAKDSHQNLQLI